MNDDLIKETANITGVAGNTDTTPIKVGMDFCPIVYFTMFSSDVKDINQNKIFKIFQKDDFFIERCKPFEKKMEYSQLADGADYYVPYFRMWPPKEGERIFKLVCIIEGGKDNCANEGDIYIEMPTVVNGLKINNAPDGILKEVYPGAKEILELSLASDADRKSTGIKDVPLIFYVLNEGEKMEVGRIHLSVAPKDVFSEEEYNKFTQAYKREIALKKAMWCIPAFRNSFQDLIEFNMRHLGAEEKNTIFTHMVSKTAKGGLIKNGYAVHSFESDFTLNSKPIEFTYHKISYTNVKNSPLHIISSAEDECIEKIKKELGYHIFAVSIMNGNHVMSLVAKVNNLHAISYDLSDQFNIRPISEGNVDSKLEEQTLHTFKFCHHAELGTSNKKLTLWKMQQK